MDALERKRDDSGEPFLDKCMNNTDKNVVWIHWCGPNDAELYGVYSTYQKAFAAWYEYLCGKITMENVK
jgi:hypothetical protein